jgi:hypothetical protein
MHDVCQCSLYTLEMPIAGTHTGHWQPWLAVQPERLSLVKHEQQSLACLHLITFALTFAWKLRFSRASPRSGTAFRAGIGWRFIHLAAALNSCALLANPSSAIACWSLVDLAMQRCACGGKLVFEGRRVCKSIHDKLFCLFCLFCSLSSLIKANRPQGSNRGLSRPTHRKKGAMSVQAVQWVYLSVDASNCAIDHRR